MAEPLATSDDVEERLGRALTTGAPKYEATRIDALLIDVSSAIRAYTNQTFTEHETTDWLPIRNGAIRLPQVPVTAVSAVEDGRGNSLSFDWLDGQERIALTSGGYLNEFELNIVPGTRVAMALVTYTHGYYVIPDDIIGLVCQLVGRALGTPSTESGVVQESITNYSYSIGGAAGSGPFGLLSYEKEILDRYRRLAGPIAVL